MAETTIVNSTSGGSVDWCLPDSVYYNGSYVDKVQIRNSNLTYTTMWEIPRASTITGYTGSSGDRLVRDRVGRSTVAASNPDAKKSGILTDRGAGSNLLYNNELTRTGDFYGDNFAASRFPPGNANVPMPMHMSWNIRPANLQPFTFNIKRLGFTLDWRGAPKDEGNVFYVKLAFTTNGDAIPSKEWNSANNALFNHTPRSIFVFTQSDGTGTYYKKGLGYVTLPEILYFDVPCNVTELTINAIVACSTLDDNNGGGGFRLTLSNIN